MARLLDGSHYVDNQTIEPSNHFNNNLQ